MKIDTKAKYDARYKKRGERMRLKQNESDFDSLYVEGVASKPNHIERAVNINDCFPLLKVGHEQHTVGRMDSQFSRSGNNVHVKL